MNQSIELQPLSFLLPAVLLVVWVIVRVGIGLISGSVWKWLFATLSLVVAWGFWWAAIAVVDGLVETASTWPFYVMAMLPALASEAVISLYVDHRSSRSGLVHWVPIGLRILLVLIMAFVLLEPVISHEEEEFSQRYVAVLIDGSASMDLSDRNADPNRDGIETTRREVSRNLLVNSQSGNASLLDQLESDYSVRIFEFADTPREIRVADLHRSVDDQDNPTASVSPAGWSNNTDIAAAIRRVNEQLPLDELSGLVLLTDGCDRSVADLQKLVGPLTQRQIPIHSVVIGDQTAVSDAQVVAVNAPRRVFLGDSVAIRAPIKVDRLAGQRVNARLIKDGKTIEERSVKAIGNRHRQTLVFDHRPDQSGVHQYTIELDPVPGERIEENNRLSSRVWVSQDSIRMLIVENRPRWEFRYLKNLFAGRDRSVQLQYVLLRPDRLAAVPDPPVMHASVNRAFDDCEATALPANEQEWLKFDVIVLGDVAPEDLGTDVIRTLETFVAKRAGTLIVVAGRHHMPHAFEQTPLADVLPVQLSGAVLGDVKSPDSSYFFKMASGADSHVVMQQSTDPNQNDSIWQMLPELYWRHSASQAKPGATVLAYAGSDRDGVSSQQAQRDNALVLWHRFGAGKVMHLAFDQTWRLRYGVGDRHHHRFWGQVLRWSVENRLAGGSQLVRVGTDRVLYREGDAVTVRARLLDKNRNAVFSEDTKALVYLDDQLVQQVLLTPESESAGMLAARIDGLAQAGKYRIELSGPTVNRLLEVEGRTDDPVSIDFALEGAGLSSEVSDLTADADVPTQLADWTGGSVTGPNDAARILENLGPKSTFTRQRSTVALWNRWPLLVSFLLVVSAEWVLRKSTGLV